MTEHSRKKLKLYINSIGPCGYIKRSNKCTLTTISVSRKYNWLFYVDNNTINCRIRSKITSNK